MKNGGRLRSNSTRRTIPIRLNELRSEFNYINKKNKEQITLEDIDSFFNGRRDLAKPEKKHVVNAFQYLDSEKKESVSKEEYINGCLEAEKKLANLINTSKANINKFKSQLEILKVKPMNTSTFAKPKKQTTDNILSLTLVEIKGYFPPDLRMRMSLYVSIRIGNQQYTTEPILNTLDPAWNKDFSLNIDKDIEIIRFEVFDLLSGDALQAYCEFSLRTIKDQLRHELWIDLRNSGNEQIPGRIHVFAQWIYSDLKKEMYTQTQEKILAERKLKDQYVIKLSMLQEPYGFLRYYEQDVSDYPQLDSPFVPIEVPSVNLEDYNQRRAQSFKPLRSFLVLDNMLWTLYIFLSIVNNWSKIDFVNTTVSVLGLATSTFVVTENVEPVVRLNLFMLTFALIFDTFWIISVGGIALEASNILTWVSFCIKLALFFRLKEKLIYTDILTLMSKNKKEDENANLVGYED